MSTHPRAQSVAEAQSDVGIALIGLQRQHGLTDTEMVQAVLWWMERMVGHMLQAERHPGEPGKPADEE